jgi:sulfur dioxygenase
VSQASRTALAIDPRLDQVDEFQEALATRDARPTHVLDTHTHADHLLPGVRNLAQRTGATVVAHAASKLRWPARRVEGGRTFELAPRPSRSSTLPATRPTRWRSSQTATDSRAMPCFVGGAGRTDFMGGSASDLFDTFRTFEALPNPAVVHPGHDYAGHAGSTIGEEKAQNPLLRERDRTVFVSRLSVKTPPPANIAAIIRHNLGELDAATIAPRELRPLLEQEAAPSFSTCAVGSSSRASASTERG